MSLDTTSFVAKHIYIFTSVDNSSDEKIELKRTLDESHLNQYKIFNFDSSWPEITSVADERFPFNAFTPCALPALIKFCISIESYISADARNYAVVHGGLGEEGLNRLVFMLCCYFLHSGIQITSSSAIQHVHDFLPGSSRAFVTPSQMRYILYYEKLLVESGTKVYTYQITHIRVKTIPLFESSIVSNGCSPYVTVSAGDSAASTSSSASASASAPSSALSTVFRQQLPERRRGAGPVYLASKHHHMDFDLERFNVFVKGDVNISLFHQVGPIKMFALSFHTGFIEHPALRFGKQAVDIASLDVEHRVFHRDFTVDVILHRVSDRPAQVPGYHGRDSQEEDGTQEDYSVINKSSLSFH